MQWLARVCVRRPVFTWVLMVSCVVVGVASLTRLGVDRFPKIDFPMVVVTTVLPGAAPQQIETEVTEKIEETLNSVAGLDELTSSSYEGFSVVAARFDLEKDLGEASEEIRDRVNRVLSQLPQDTKPPQVQRMDPDAAPVMLVALRTSRSVREATDFADRVIRRRIESLPGVGGVSILGGEKREIQVITRPAALASVGFTVRDLQRALATQNVEIPSGNVEQGARSLQLRVQGRIRDPKEFALIPIGNRGGTVIRVGDVADVIDGAEEAQSAATMNGHAVVMLAIRKQSGSNTVAVVDALHERIGSLRMEIPAAYKLEIVRDESAFIRNAIHAVQEHLIIGGFLAALVVLIFLRNGRSTIIAALAIPTSIIATFAVLKALGLTLNVITLLGLTLSVGIVIDDAIVVLENIVRFIEEKDYAPMRAALVATEEIGLAVLATSLSLVAVFLPIAFMGGIIGRFMSSFGFTMSFAVLVSLLVSFTLTPMLCSRWLKGSRASADGRRHAEVHDETEHAQHEEHDSLEIPDPKAEPRAEERATYLAWIRGERGLWSLPGYERAHEEGGRIYQWFEHAYLKLLAFSMRYRWAVGIALVVSILSLGITMPRVAKNFLPTDDESRFEVTVRTPEGTSLAQTQLIGERAARAVRNHPAVESTVLTVGAPAGDISGRGANQASLYVRLVPSERRTISQDEVIAQARSKYLPAATPPGTQMIVGPISPMGGSGQQNAPVQYILNGPDLDKLERYAQSMLIEIRKIPGVGDASTSLVTGRPAYDVQIDRRRAADLGVSVVDISNALRLMVGGVVVTNYAEGSEQYDVRVRAPIDARNRPDEIAQLTVPTATGGSVRLADIAKLTESTGPTSIQHHGRQRQATLFINTLPGASEQAILDRLDGIRDRIIDDSAYHGAVFGRSREMARAMASFLFAVVLALTFMYLVLAAQFESWLHPITILASLPLTLPFAVLSVLLMGQSMNLFSTLGIFVLFGVVKKNSILQVDHVRTLRRRGFSRADAVMAGNRDRLRPILMTTLAFVAGMIPLLVSSGAGAGTNRALGSVVAGGQTLSLLLTLVATPVIFSWLDDLTHARWAVRIGEALRWPLVRLDEWVSRKTPPPPIHHGEHPAGEE